MPEDSQLSPLRLRLDLAWAKGLLWLVSSGRFATPKPEAHRFMFDRYWRLADHHERNGAARRAARLRTLAEYHYRAGGLDDLPLAVAVRCRFLVGRALPGPSRLNLMNRVTMQRKCSTGCHTGSPFQRFYGLVARGASAL